MNAGPGLAVLAAAALVVAVWLALAAAYGFALACGLIAGGVAWVWRRDHG